MGAYRRPTYVFSEPQVPGVVAATNHLALTNPAGSGKVIILGGVFISQVTNGETAAAQPMRGYRATEVSGGTLENVSGIAKAVSTLPDPVGQIRTGNVTATLGAAWFNSPALRATGQRPEAESSSRPVQRARRGTVRGRTVRDTDSGDAISTEIAEAITRATRARPNAVMPA